MTAPIVQVIGAKWCAQCPAIKQSVTNWCAMVGLTPELLDYNELETKYEIEYEVDDCPQRQMIFGKARKVHR